jgi:hypothetical protein
MMPHSLDVGDEVIIRADLQYDRYYPYMHKGCLTGMYVNDEMAELAGETAKITAVVESCTEIFRLDIDDEEWSWTASMFEPCRLAPAYDDNEGNNALFQDDSSYFPKPRLLEPPLLNKRKLIL